jgi:hypothetical protein
MVHHTRTTGAARLMPDGYFSDLFDHCRLASVLHFQTVLEPACSIGLLSLTEKEPERRGQSRGSEAKSAFLRSTQLQSVAPTNLRHQANRHPRAAASTPRRPNDTAHRGSAAC